MATFSPSQSTVPMFSSSETYVTMPQISSTVGQAILAIELLARLGLSSVSTMASPMAVKPMSHSKKSTPTASASMPTTVMRRLRTRTDSVSVSVAPEPPSSSATSSAFSREAASDSPSSRRPIRPRPPKSKNVMAPSTMLNTSEVTNSSSGLPSRPPSRSATASLAIVPNTLSGENPPAVAPLITISPIRMRGIP